MCKLNCKEGTGAAVAAVCTAEWCTPFISMRRTGIEVVHAHGIAMHCLGDVLQIVPATAAIQRLCGAPEAWEICICQIPSIVDACTRAQSPRNLKLTFSRFGLSNVNAGTRALVMPVMLVCTDICLVAQDSSSTSGCWDSCSAHEYPQNGRGAQSKIQSP